MSKYYEDISEDDSVFDLIDDINRIRGFDERIMDFDLDYLDDITVNDVSNNAVDISSKGEDSEHGETYVLSGSTVDCGDTVKGNSVSREDVEVDDSCDGYSKDDDSHDGDSRDGDSRDGDSKDGDSRDDSRDGDSRDGNSHDGDSRDGDSRDGDSKDGDSRDDSRDGDSRDGNSHDGDSRDGDSHDGDSGDGDSHDGDSGDGDSGGDDCYRPGSYHSDGDGFTSDDSWGINNDDVHSVICISSDDEMAVVPSLMQTRTQTFVVTLRRQTRFLGNRELNTIASVERDYFENWN